MAAISFQDTLAYMIYDTNEDEAPDIDFEYPQVSGNAKVDKEVVLPSKFSSDPNNKVWITGPIGFTSENEASLRLLDAISCATRSYVDVSIEADGSDSGVKATKFNSCISYLLAEIALSGHNGHLMLAKALVVLQREMMPESKEQRPEDILDVLKAVIQQPLTLFQGGCTHILAHKIALIAAHYINKLHEKGSSDLDEALDIYNAFRVVLNTHSSKLPNQLGCSPIPRPNLSSETLIEIEDETKKAAVTSAEKKLNTSIEKEFDINDKSFLVLLSGCF